MLFGGQPVTFIRALPHLLRIANIEKKVRASTRCRCTVGPCRNAPPRRRNADGSDGGPLLPMLDWSVCPHGLLRAPFFAVCEELLELGKIAPIAGWPNKLPPWAVRGVMALREYEVRNVGRNKG